MVKTHSTVSALERSPSHLLHRALQLALDIYAEEAGSGAVTQRQFAVLAAVQSREGCTQSDLVKATGIDRSTLAELVARLIGKGLLARERSTLDARANTVTLTEAGRAAVAEAEPRVALADERILALVPSAKRESFLKTLADMAKAAGKPHAEPEAEAAEKRKAKAEKKAKTEKVEKAEKKKKKKKAKAEKKAKAAVVEPTA
ncbi:MAG TPA: MarR family winged helix-turn-helix transcriptional regulator [Caulobacteraceae bacterium]|nr:MarR family winged helix-turn-helix transcriptional regulator [Caulobacteraceae bacterium]